MRGGDDKAYHESTGGDNGTVSMEIRARVLLASRLNVPRINRAEPFSRKYTAVTRIRPQLDKGDLYERTVPLVVAFSAPARVRKEYVPINGRVRSFGPFFRSLNCAWACERIKALPRGPF